MSKITNDELTLSGTGWQQWASMGKIFYKVYTGRGFVGDSGASYPST